MKKRETRRDKFVRLAETRTEKALDALRLIGNLSNRSNYDYTTADVAAIFDALESELRLHRERFHQPDAPRTPSFKLSDPSRSRS
jgi:hypothetical protein